MNVSVISAGCPDMSATGALSTVVLLSKILVSPFSEISMIVTVVDIILISMPPILKKFICTTCKPIIQPAICLVN